MPISFLADSKKTVLFNKILYKYNSLADQLSSRLIKDITFNMNAANCILPNVCAKILQYIVDNRDYVLGETVEKALFCCYRLGYIPENDEILKCSADIIQRYKISVIYLICCINASFLSIFQGF